MTEKHWIEGGVRGVNNSITGQGSINLKLSSKYIEK